MNLSLLSSHFKCKIDLINSLNFRLFSDTHDLDKLIMMKYTKNKN